MPVFPVSSEFGEIILNDGTRLDYDVVLFPPHTVLKRKKSLSKNERNKYNHTPFSLSEAQYYLAFHEKQNTTPPDIFLIATGHYGSLPITPEAKEFLKQKNITMVIERTPQAIEQYQTLLNQGKTLIALFHITC